MLKLLDHLNEGDVTAEVAAEIESDLKNEDKAAVAKSRSRRPPLNFYEMGLRNGDMLHYIQDDKVTCTIVSAKRVSFNGEERSLTSVNTELLGSKWGVQPTPYWTFNGHKLRDLYDEINPIPEE